MSLGRLFDSRYLIRTEHGIKDRSKTSRKSTVAFELCYFRTVVGWGTDVVVLKQDMVQ